MTYFKVFNRVIYRFNITHTILITLLRYYLFKLRDVKQPYPLTLWIGVTDEYITSDYIVENVAKEVQEIGALCLSTKCRN